MKCKFGYNQKKELETLPRTIELLESEQEELFREVADPNLYKKDKAEIVSKTKRLEELKEELSIAYNRWEELEELKNKSR